MQKKNQLTVLELCAGGGGQALGCEMAGFEPVALVELDKDCCNTLSLNRPSWHVVNEDLHHFDATKYSGVDLVAGGVPCPPFSKAGKQLGSKDERDLFPQAVRIVQECRPRAVMLENVRGLLDKRFDEYREKLDKEFFKAGYTTFWKLLNSSDYGVPQLRPRVVMVAIETESAGFFEWPKPHSEKTSTVGETIYDLMESNGWKGAKEWRSYANQIAPTIVGGSKKHGGPDLGPTRAKKAWLALGVNGLSIANEAPEVGFEGNPRLTVRMVARIQGFPDSWKFAGKKTASYRQVGNAFPPPVAAAVASQIANCLNTSTIEKVA